VLGDLYNDSAQSNNDGGDRQNNARITFGARPGIETNKAGAVQ